MADTLVMVFSEADKAIIKYYHEKGYTTYKMWKDNPEKHWDKTSGKRPIKRFEAFGSMKKQNGSGRAIFFQDGAMTHTSNLVQNFL